jgi:hypothetical protein
MFATSSSRPQPPIPLFPDREAHSASVATGVITDPLLDRLNRRAGLCLVEFIGGPLDGYQEGLRAEDLAETFAIPVTSFALAALAGSKVVGQRREPTSVAIYELDSDFDSTARYFFLGAAAPEQIYRG